MKILRVIFVLILIATFSLTSCGGSSKKIDICDCMNKGGYTNKPDIAKVCNEKFKEVFGTIYPSVAQMAKYSVNNCCSKYPDKCNTYKNLGY